MDKIHSIRQLYYEQGKTIPEIITETGHDRKTITKYLDMTDFNAQEPVTPDPEDICPKLEPYKSLIDTWLMEDKKVPRKQRHTARRVYRRLGKEVDGFDCSYRLVAQYVVSCIIKIPIIADGSPQSCRRNFPIIAEPCLVFS